MMQEGRDWDRLVVSRKDTTGEERVVGHTQIRKGGIAKVTGTAQYGADVDLPGQLYGAAARSPYPHARILKIATTGWSAMKEPNSLSWPGRRCATRESRWPPWPLTPRRSPVRPPG